MPAADLAKTSLDRLDAVASAMERKWGIDRLPKLVDAPLAVRFRRQAERLDEAIRSDVSAAVSAQAKAMLRAWNPLDAAALAGGWKPLAPTIWEAVLPRSGRIASGVTEFRPGRFEGAGMAFLRFEKFLADLNRDAGPFDAVVFEEVRAHAGTLAAQVYGGFLAHLTAWCERKAAPYLGVPVATIKRHATGKGNAPKEDVIRAVRAQGFLPKDDNDANALSIGQGIRGWALGPRDQKRSGHLLLHRGLSLSSRAKAEIPMESLPPPAKGRISQ